MKRLGGAAECLGARRWAARQALQPPTGGRHGAKPEARRRQRRPGAGARRRPARAARSAPNDRELRFEPGRVIDTAIPFAAALQARGVAATGKHFPGSAPRADTDFAVQRIRLDARELRARRRGALPAIRRARRRHGDDQHRDLPRTSRTDPAAFTRRSPPASCATASASRASRSPTRSDRRRRATSAGPRRRASRRRGPAPTCCSTPTTARRRRRASRSGTACGPGVYARPGFERSVQRVLDLRSRLGSR